MVVLLGLAAWLLAGCAGPEPAEERPTVSVAPKAEAVARFEAAKARADALRQGWKNGRPWQDNVT